MRPSDVLDRLAAFAASHGFRGKGPLCVALVITEHGQLRGLPLDANLLITAREGQVLGLGKGAVQRILSRHGITKTLAAEGGRTSRGSLGKMREYVEFLNTLALTQAIDLASVECFWIERVRDHFAAKPFVLRMDPALSVRAAFRALIEQVEARQRSADGASLVGSVLQHLVGAKLEVALHEQSGLVHHGSNTNDAKARGGDFDIGDASIHVTTSPGPAVIDKCRANLDAGRKPVIITLRSRVAMAEALAEDGGIATRIDVIEFEQFMATNIHELGLFGAVGRAATIEAIVVRYCAIVAEHEADPGLMIEISAR